MTEFSIANAVARAISRAIEDDAENHTQWIDTPEGELLHGPDGAILILGDEGELRNSTNGKASDFTIVLSDGSRFNVRVSEEIDD